MPKIIVYANYEFTNDSNHCADNGELSMLYDVPKSWLKWNEEKRQAWLEKNSEKIEKEVIYSMCVNDIYDHYEDVE